MNKFQYAILNGLMAGLCFISCFDKSAPSNPLEGQATEPFVPEVIHPKGNEQFFPGTTQEILWNPADLLDDAIVSIQLECEDIPAQMIAEDIPNKGVYTWQVPNTPSPACRIRVIGRGGPSLPPANDFRINPLPVLARLEIGGEGYEPTAFEDLVVFTSERSGNADLWQFDRHSHMLTQLTFDTGFDGEADLQKIEQGNAMPRITYTSEQSGQKEIWADGQQITSSGGEHPAWGYSGTINFPTLAYVKTDVGKPQALVFMSFSSPLPISSPIAASAVSLAGANGTNLISGVKSVSWNAPRGFSHQLIVYDTGSTQAAALWGVAFDSNTNFFKHNIIDLTPVGLMPTHPALSIDGTRLAFSSGGDLWVTSHEGGLAIQLTFGEDHDDFPDWATDNEIVFQRGDGEIWAIQVP